MFFPALLPRLCFSSVSWFNGGTPRAVVLVAAAPRPLAILLPVSIDGTAHFVGVEPLLLVKHVPTGSYKDRGTGSIGVGAPHRLVERAVGVAREVVREDYLCGRVGVCGDVVI